MPLSRQGALTEATLGHIADTVRTVAESSPFDHLYCNNRRGLHVARAVAALGGFSLLESDTIGMGTRVVVLNEQLDSYKWLEVELEELGAPDINTVAGVAVGFNKHPTLAAELRVRHELTLTPAFMPPELFDALRDYGAIPPEMYDFLLANDAIADPNRPLPDYLDMLEGWNVE